MKDKKTILIVDDEQDVRDVLTVALNARGFLTLESTNGRDGVDIALANRPDLILLDLVMPIMDGITAFKNIRGDSWGKDIPVIILTNLSVNDEKLVEDVVKYKPVHYLVKSDWKMADVVERIEAEFKE